MNLSCLSHTDLRSVVTRASTDAHILLPKAQSFALTRQKIILTRIAGGAPSTLPGMCVIGKRTPATLEMELLP